jgi:amino acid permease
MLKTFYESIGFLGALLLALGLFVFFIIWVAGIAGITLPVDGGKPRGSKTQIAIAIFVPIYPIIWLFYEMYHQRKFIKKEDNDLTV